MFLTSFIFNCLALFLATTKTPAEGVNAIWEGLGKALAKIKEGLYAIVPEIMTAMGDFWIVLLPFAMFVIITFLLWLKRMIKGV